MKKFVAMANDDSPEQTFNVIVYYPTDDGNSVTCGVMGKMSYSQTRDLSRMMANDCKLELRDANDAIIYEGPSNYLFRQYLNDISYHSLNRW